jgi:biopolymer transport protein ExbD
MRLTLGLAAMILTLAPALTLAETAQAPAAPVETAKPAAETAKPPAEAVKAPAAPDESAAKPPAGKDVVIRTLGGVVVDTKAKEVRLAGKVCLQRGSLELLACARNSKEHESIFVLDAKPSHVAFALALVGLEPGKPGYETDGGAFSPPAGSVVDVTVRFLPPSGPTPEIPVWKLLKPAGAQSGLEQPIQWVYVGAASPEALAGADNDGTIITLSNFQYAVVDVPFESSSDNSKLGYDANPAAIPAVGTPAEIILRPTGGRVEPRKVEIEIVVRPGQPILLDGQPVTLEKFAETVNHLPVEIQNAVLRADPEEKFGRILEIHEILREALMKTKMVIIRPAVALTVTAEGQVQVGREKLSVAEFTARAEKLVKGATRVDVAADPKADPKIVKAVMDTVRGQGAPAYLKKAEVPAEKPAEKAAEK